jgi:hypothetical protein
MRGLEELTGINKHEEASFFLFAQFFFYFFWFDGVREHDLRSSRKGMDWRDVRRCRGTCDGLKRIADQPDDASIPVLVTISDDAGSGGLRGSLQERSVSVRHPVAGE